MERSTAASWRVTSPNVATHPGTSTSWTRSRSSGPATQPKKGVCELSSSSKDIVYVDERWLLMRWDGEHECLVAEWKGFATSAEFQGALLKAIDVIRDKNGAAFVTDTRKLELVSDSDQRWLMSTWPTLAIAAGLKRLAIVMAKTGLSKM